LDVLDGLRGIAVLLVLWYHVWEISWLPAPFAQWFEFVPETGFVGVHLFFFLSGVVIAFPFVRSRWADGPTPTWLHFAWRRYMKIVPSYLLSIAVAYAIGYAQYETIGGNAFADIGSHLLFIHTWFSQTYGAINGVLWTLAVEVEFYLLFPLIWWCFRRGPWLTAAAMIGVALAWRHILAACCYTTTFPQWEENLPGYLDMFAFGMIAAYAYVRWIQHIGAASHKRILATAFAVGGFLALAFLLRDLYFFRAHDQWSGVWQIDRRSLLGLCFAVIALGSLAGTGWWRAIIANRILIFLGAISYNLYLYHQLIARELLWHHIPGFATKDPHGDPRWQVAYTVVAFVVTIGQAAIVTYLFERPLLRIKIPEPARPLGGASGH
jgi:peptidoglycan/LPS O-acetylase OafA/YrhL